MKIGIAQMNTRAGDFSQTADRMVEYSRQAYKQGVELLVFPMAVLTGPTPVNESDAEGFTMDLLSTLEALSVRLLCPCIVPVVTNVDDESVWCEAMLIQNDEVVPLRLSSYLASQMSQEDGIGLPGGAVALGSPGSLDEGSSLDLPRFELNGLKIGVAITYDDLDDYAEYSTGVDVLIYLSGYGYAFDDPTTALGAALAENRFADDARTMDAWIVAAGSLGGYGPAVYTGSSFVMAPWGELAASAPGFEEALVVAEVDPVSEGPLVHPLVPEVYNRAQYLWETLCLGLHDYLNKLGEHDAVVVLDGCLPSSVLAALACDALGPLRVHAVVPEGLEGQRRADALELARRLRIDLRDLGGSASAGPASAGPVDQSDTLLARDLAQVQAAAFAREVGGVVLGSQDKTYLALEAQPTDVVVAALMPLGDVYRSELIELARLRNTISPVIPEGSERAYEVPQVGEAAPGISAEARLSRIDATLATYVEWASGLTDTIVRQGDADLTQAIVNRLRACEPARVGRSLVLMVSTRTLFDARSPLGLAWRDHPRANEERITPEEMFEHLEHLQQQQEPDDTEGDESAPADMRDVLGFLRDFLQSGAWTSDEGQRGAQPGLGGTMNWGGPFSEN